MAAALALTAAASAVPETAFAEAAWSPPAGLSSRWVPAEHGLRALATGSDVDVWIGERASDPWRIADRESGLAVTVRLDDATAAPVLRRPNGIRYPSAAPGGGAIVMRLLPDGIEDYVEVIDPAVRQLSYTLDVSDFASLRQAGGALELIDGDGIPRLRMQPPHVVDSIGVRHAAGFEVLGCSVDRDPRPPWRRTPAPLEASLCRLVLSWSADVSYPLWVDPAWVGTQRMLTPRTLHAAITGPGGEVILIAGNDAAVNSDLALGALRSAEAFDPKSNRWSPAGELVQVHAGGSLLLLADGRLLATGGVVATAVDPIGAAEIYDPVTSTSRLLEAKMTAPRLLHQSVLLPDGRVLVVGGVLTYDASTNAVSSTEIFDPATETFSVGPELKQPRATPILYLVDGGVLAAGGFVSLTEVLASAELLDLETQQWRFVSPIPVPRLFPGVHQLHDGRLWLLGGNDGLGQITRSTDIYDPEIDSWQSGPELLAARGGFAITRLDNSNTLLLAGGSLAFGNSLASAEVFLPDQQKWVTASPMSIERRLFSLTQIAGGRVLAAGGVDDQDQVLSSAEIFQRQRDGETCTAAGDCLSGSCEQGACGGVPAAQVRTSFFGCAVSAIPEARWPWLACLVAAALARQRRLPARRRRGA